MDPVFEDGQASQMGGYAYAGDGPVGNIFFGTLETLDPVKEGEGWNRCWRSWHADGKPDSHVTI